MTPRSASHEVPPARKQKLTVGFSELVQHARHLDVPIGCKWSQNSCAYDSLFTPLFSLWCNDRDYWTENLRDMGNAVTDLLVSGFSCYEKGEGSLEDARDDAKHFIACCRNGVPFGQNTSIENVCSHFLRTNRVIFERHYICPNGHSIHHSNDYDAVILQGVNEYESITQWVSPETHHVNARCQTCHHMVNIRLKFHHCPLLLVFSMLGLRLHLDSNFLLSVDNHNCMYTLIAVVYYADLHFTAQIITRDGIIWYYDGLALVNQNVLTLEYMGSMHCHPDMLTCKNSQACAAIYAKL